MCIRDSFTITSENGSLLLKIVDPALVDALAESDEKQDGAKEFDEESPEEAGEEPSDDPDDEVFDETENEPGIMGGDTAIQEDQEGSEGDYYEVDYDEEANRPDPAEDETPTTFASDNWRISTTNSLVARPILAGIDTDGITYRIESDVNGEAVVTVYNSTAKVCYVFSLVARHGALSVSRYQVLDEISATTQEDLDQSLSGMGEIISGLQPYTPPPVPEEQEGEQDDGLGEQEQQAENEGSD